MVTLGREEVAQENLFFWGPIAYFLSQGRSVSGILNLLFENEYKITVIQEE